MLDQKGFDLWADQYDEAVKESEGANEYPFAGYRKVLNTIYGTIRQQKNNAAVLDIGFGTGTLSKKLYDDGYHISGMDFSAEMIRIARPKMPDAKLVQYDFANGLAPDFAKSRFDFITITYALHHMPDEKKVPFLQELRKHLNPGGKILIGDISFRTQADRDACRKVSGEQWDDAEYYIIFEKLAPQLPDAQFTPISFCAGITEIDK
ncbi:MAG: class I SAM-dependent methyltransferase [Oscillospiraceae bacterium]|nr:class I SAM-dependent methyltransferase [Oscillospiraceae bacterium]